MRSPPGTALPLVQHYSALVIDAWGEAALARCTTTAEEVAALTAVARAPCTPDLVAAPTDG